MKKVITYGTYDLLHFGHIRLLERAKALGDYLIVGVTTDSFDRERGKLNVHGNVMRRVESVKRTGLVDEIILEEYVGQKIDDIINYNIDVFVIGSDWEGKFDYLKEYCEVVYLSRTEGVSSTSLRNENQEFVKLGIIGTGRMANRFQKEAKFISGIEINSVYNPIITDAAKFAAEFSISNPTDNFDIFISNIDAVYIASPHLTHYSYIKNSLLKNKHVLCETPMVLSRSEAEELLEIAKSKQLVLLEANKTAYCPGFNHVVTLIKSGIIGSIVDIDASTSTIKEGNIRERDASQVGGSITENSASVLLPIFKIFGTNVKRMEFISKFQDGIDIFTKGIIYYENFTASFKVGLGVKTEGSLIISGTKGYVYVHAPWWKTEYFEVRYENVNNNKKFFYKFEGDGLRYEIQEFMSCINNRRLISHKLLPKEMISHANVIEKFLEMNNTTIIH